MKKKIAGPEKRKKKKKIPNKKMKASANNYPSLFGLAHHPLTLETAFGQVQPHVFAPNPNFGADYFM